MTNEYESDAVTSLADDNSIQWKVVNIDGTHEENLAKINALTADDKFVKIVMQVDWRPNVFVYLNTGGYVIWDLNGHKVWFNGVWDLRLKLELLEITDSSAAGDGKFWNNTPDYGTIDNWPRRGVIISGGELRIFGLGKDRKLVMTGGRITTGTTVNQSWNILYKDTVNYYAAPWIDTSDPRTFETVAYTGATVLAISQSDTYCGAHNTAYGVAWDLRTGSLLEHLTADRPYYLWRRDAGDAWYHLWTTL